ncbi:MAG: CDP-glycerol glycerophosphotransferase family protein [Anaerostipes sp.]|nr:CDP-glycerol glycerophosphotransferase family protein [Anaerostipes sp.]
MIIGLETRDDKELEAKANALLRDPSDAVKTALYYGSKIKEAIQSNTIFFEADGGNSISGFPQKMFEACVADKRFNNYTFIWSVSKKVDTKVFEEKYPSIQVIRGKGNKYKEALATSENIVTDTKLPYYFFKREEQEYIRFFEEKFYAGCREYSPTENIDQRRMVIKDLLNTSFLCSFDSEMTKNMLKINYNLDTAYCGNIVEIKDKYENCLNDLLWEILSDKEISDSIRCKTNKKRVVIYADFNASEWWQKRLIRVVNQIDFDQYDITVISKVVRGDFGIKSLESLDSRVRVLMRSGHMNVTTDKYRIYDYLQRGYLALENSNEIGQKISKSTLEDEWKRMTGKTSFDIGIMCDSNLKDQNGIWNELFCRGPIQKKYFVCWENLRDEKTRGEASPDMNIYLERYINAISNFDKILFVSMSEKKYFDDNFSEYKLQSSVFPDFLPKDFSSNLEEPMDTCVYQSEKYLILNQQGSSRLKTISIVKEPSKDKYNCISNITSYSKECMNRLLEKFCSVKAKKENAKLYLIDGIGFMKEADYEQIRNDKVLNGNVFVICGIDLKQNYIQKFQEYIVFDEEGEEDLYKEFISSNNR